MPLKPLTTALYLDNYGFERTLRLGYLIHPRTHQFRKNGLTTRAEGGTNWTIDCFERAVMLHVQMVASRGCPHILDIVEGLSHYICRQWRLNHIEKTITLHVRMVASHESWPSTFSTLSKDCRATCADSSASTTSRRLFCYMCRQWSLEHIEKTVTLHLRTVAFRGHPHILDFCRRTVALHVPTVVPQPHREDHYATCADGSASWSLQILSTLSSNHLATCADSGASTTTLRYMCGLALPCMALPHAS